MKTLFPHQIKAVEILRDQSRYLLSDSMGLGKSCTATKVAEAKDARTILVLCPKSLCLNWGKEIREWDSRDPTILTTTKSYWRGDSDITYYIYNWDSLVVASRLEEILSRKYDLIIADEYHRALKNWSAKRCKNFAFHVLPLGKAFLPMSGTPITRSAADLHPILSMLLPGKIGKFQAFQEKFCERVYTGFGRTGYEYRGFRNEAELHGILASVMLRRTKEEVLPDLPAKLYKEVPLEIGKSLLAESLKVSADTVESYVRSQTPLPGHLASILRAVGNSKVPSAVEYLSDLGVPTVVFAHHREVIERLARELRELEFSVGVIHGGVSDVERQQIVDDFQNGDLNFFIGQIDAAGTGITLTRSSNVVFVEFPWSPAALRQCEDRVHRITQQNSVLVHYLVSEGGIDEMVLRVIAGKEDGITKIVEAA